MDISVIIPVYNSNESIPVVLEHIHAFFNTSSRKWDYEIVLINDFSNQATYDVLERLRQTDFGSGGKAPVVIHLEKNVGQQMAICHGLKYATGTYALTMDDDLQHDIKDLEALFEQTELGADLVFGIYAQHGDEKTRAAGSKWIGKFFKVKFKKLNGSRVSSYRLIHKSIYTKIEVSKKSFVYLSAELIPYASKISNVTIQRLDRPFGKSGYTLIKCIKIALKLAIYYGFKSSNRIE